jgi:hypothetical protein
VDKFSIITTKQQGNSYRYRALYEKRDSIDSLVKKYTDFDSLNYLYNSKIFEWSPDSISIARSIQIYQKNILLREIKYYGWGNLRITAYNNMGKQHIIDYNLYLYLMTNKEGYEEYNYSSDNKMENVYIHNLFISDDDPVADGSIKDLIIYCKDDNIDNLYVINKQLNKTTTYLEYDRVNTSLKEISPFSIDCKFFRPIYRILRKNAIKIPFIWEQCAHYYEGIDYSVPED